MNFLKKIVSGAVFAFMLTTLIPFAFAAEGDVEVDFLVRGADTIGVEDATLSVYFWNETTGEYELQADTYTSNSSGRVNNVLVPEGTYFYGVATDDSGTLYARSNAGFDNVWVAESTGIMNIETGSVRSTNFVHLYPGETPLESGEEASDPTPESGDDTSSDTDVPVSPGADDDIPADTPSDTTSDDSSSDTTVDTEGDVELEVTVFDEFRNPIEGATVTLYTRSGTAFDSDLTSSDGRTRNIMISEGQEFYGAAVGPDGEPYGGTYDHYYDRPNYWITEDSETLENTGTGLTRILYLHLYPDEFVPAGYEGSDDDFDPYTYRCGDFPDAVYATLSPEECAAISYVKDESIFTGTDAGMIELNRPINRAEVTKVMVEAFGITQIGAFAGIQAFPDVPMNFDVWFSKYVYTARANDIVGGYPDGYFRPVNTINRVELLRIFLEASGKDMSEIPRNYTFWQDVTVDAGTSWFIGYANTAFFEELLDHNGSLQPAKAMTRLDVIKLIYRAKLLEE